MGHTLGFEGSAIIGANGTDPLIIMLCETDDPECHDPVLVRPVADTETDGDPIQTSFGPEITVTGLPEGDYLFLVFTDARYTPNSDPGAELVSMGLAWDDDFENPDPRWGGHCSEGDRLLSETGERPSRIDDGAYNPPATPVEVSLTSGETVDLETVELGHFYERDINPDMATEDGIVVVSTYTGVRFIDMSVWPYELQDAYPGFEGPVEYQFVDEDEEILTGSLCNMIRGPGNTVFVLFADDAGGGAGYAVHFDPATREQLGMVNWPAVEPGYGHPCLGTYHEHGGDSFLVTFGEHALWSAKINDLSTSGTVEGHVVTADDDGLLEVETGMRSIAAYEDELFLGFIPGPVEDSVPADAQGTRALFFADLDTADGSVTIRHGEGAAPENLVWEQITSAVREPIQTTHNGEVECYSSGMGTDSPGLFVAHFHDGRDLLFAGGCSQIIVFDIADDFSRLDYSPTPGIRGLDTTMYGHQISGFQLSPDGNTLWAFPSEKSRIPLSCQWGTSDMRSEHNRYMAMAIDLTTGDVPNPSEEYLSGNDIDDFEGLAGLGDGYNTPGDDPGIDLNLTYYSCYQLRLAYGSSGVTNNSGTIPTSPGFTVTNTTLWMRGLGAEGSGSSGMGKLGNIASYSLDERRAYFWPLQNWGADHPYYYYWTSGVSADYPMGFDITPVENGHVATTASIFIPVD